MTMVVAGAIGGGASIVTGIIGMGSAKKARRRAEREAQARAAELARLERSRQAIINPYEGVRDISSLASDLSGMISNPYASLGVATKAAEFEAEQADLSLANTLDALKETGASAGGATALAQAALRSKQGISANIEQQEAANEKLRAQGEQQMQQLKMSEAQRLQGIKMSEAQRVQSAEAAGKEFMFSTRENREVAQMDRVAGQMQNAQAQAAQARADQMGALTGMIGGITSSIGSMASSGAFSNTPATSDRRLKTDIKNIGVSPSGLNIYSFKYKDDKFGSGIWQGVMADEVPSFAVSKNNEGYSQVDYSLIDVEFKQI